MRGAALPSPLPSPSPLGGRRTRREGRRKRTEEEEDEDEEEVGGDGFLRKGGEGFVWFSEIRGCSDDL